MGESLPKDLQEVKSLREVPRPPEHCGVPMRRMTSATHEGMVTVWVCSKDCGRQIREKAVKA